MFSLPKHNPWQQRETAKKKEQKIVPVILGTGYLSAAVHLFLMPIHLAPVYLGSQTCCRLSFIPSQYCITGVHTGYVSLEQMRRDIKCCGTVHDEGNHRAPWASVNKGSSLSPLKSQLKKNKKTLLASSLWVIIPKAQGQRRNRKKQT